MALILTAAAKCGTLSAYLGIPSCPSLNGCGSVEPQIRGSCRDLAGKTGTCEFQSMHLFRHEPRRMLARIIEQNRELMSDDADVLLGLLAEAQQMEKAYLLVQERRALLLRCQAVGIKTALAEDRDLVGARPIPDPDGIGEILHELNNPASCPRYAASCQHLQSRVRTP